MRSVAFRGQKLPRTRRIWMLDKSLHPHQTNTHRLQGFFFPGATASARARGVGRAAKRGLSPGPPQRGPRGRGCSGPRSFRGQALLRCRPFVLGARTPERGGRTHARLPSVTGRYQRRACPAPPTDSVPHTPAPRHHRTPESRSQPVVIAIQEAVQDAGEILRPQFLLFLALSWRPGETRRQRENGWAEPPGARGGTRTGRSGHPPSPHRRGYSPRRQAQAVQEGDGETRGHGDGWLLGRNHLCMPYFTPGHVKRLVRGGEEDAGPGWGGGGGAGGGGSPRRPYMRGAPVARRPARAEERLISPHR